MSNSNMNNMDKGLRHHMIEGMAASRMAGHRMHRAVGVDISGEVSRGTQSERMNVRAPKRDRNMVERKSSGNGGE